MNNNFIVVPLLVSLSLMTGCRPCEYQTIDLGPLPEEILAKVPYQNGRVYEFDHSGGHTIRFSTVRATEKKRSDPDLCFCNGQIVNIYLSEVNTTILKPDYPIFNIQLQLNNHLDSSYSFSIAIGSAFFTIPLQASDTAYWPVSVADSLQIANKSYKEVFKLKNPGDYWYTKDSIRVDSLYYNYDQGILLIKMTNQEYYAIHP